MGVLIVYRDGTLGVNVDQEWWFCECEEPAWDGVECTTCHRKPRDRMRV